jgi:aconitate hydratase
MSRNTLNTLKEFPIGGGQSGQFHSLPALAENLGVNLSRLPVSIRIVLESVLRNCDGKKVTEEHVKQLANWGATAERTDEIPFVVARVVLQDFTGVPLWPTWPRCATSPPRPAPIRRRSSRWCRSTWWSTTR